MADYVKVNSTLVSGRKDETLTFTRYIKDYETGKSLIESLNEKRNKEDKIQASDLADNSVDTNNIRNLSIISDHICSKAILERHLASGVVTVEKIAEEVWDKLRNEYLRLDGKARMLGDLILENHYLSGGQLSAYLRFYGQDTIIGYIDTGADIDGPTEDIKLLTISWGESILNSQLQATGFKTANQSSLGLLGNEGSVITAMSDSDVDACFQMVFA